MYDATRVGTLSPLRTFRQERGWENITESRVNALGSLGAGRKTIPCLNYAFSDFFA